MVTGGPSSPMNESDRLTSPAPATRDRYAIRRYRVRHRTHYRYAAPVAVCQNQLRMRPRGLPSVTVHGTQTVIQPLPTTREQHVDYFGNEVETFAIEVAHHELVVDVASEVTVDAFEATPRRRAVPWRPLVDQLRQPVANRLVAESEFCATSPRITPSPKFRDYALPSFEKHASLIDAAIDLTERIRADFTYDTSATHVGTPVEDAFQQRAGVCQDFAQIQIACFRSLGLAAKYVSGYLRTYPPPGQKKRAGADESHAWASLFIGPEAGWLDLDPTNGCVTANDHIPICFGRDYVDVSPMRGVAIGGGQTTLSVAVDVEPLNA